jgi:PIN domain nuclease of toxin-antitoxin system
MAIFDAAPLVAVLLGEPGGLASGRLLAEPNAHHAICALNAAEVLDTVSRDTSEPAGEVVATMQLWFESGVRIVPLDWQRAQRAAELRSRHYHRTRTPVSLAGCAAIALAEQLETELVTSDAPMVRVARAIGVGVIAVPDSSGRTPK